MSRSHIFPGAKLSSLRCFQVYMGMGAQMGVVVGFDAEGTSMQDRVV